jgi:RNA polymerase sigma factor (sigma-70 family)
MAHESRLHQEAYLTGSRRTDGELLERFALGQDSAAFAELVRRHGPAVWAACRRVLRNAQDTEDAFQVTFLILVRSVDKVRKRESLKSWLQGVARRVAMKASRAQTRRGRFLEKLLMAEEMKPKASAPMNSEFWSIVSEELSALPEKQRLVLQKSLFEGQSYERLAESLNLPIATVASHIRRGKQVLRARLTARGLAVASVASTASLAAATVPSEVCAATVQGATAVLTGQLNLLPVHIVSLMKGAMTNMATTGKLLLLLVLGVATVTAPGIWYMRQSNVESSSIPVADITQPGPTLEAALHLDVKLPPGTNVQEVSAGPSLTLSN